jgi:hypothetical protein
MMNRLLEKVKCAALTMQRYDWEQGVVAQAFLEAGDHDTAILLAIEAAHRQDKYGRCAAIGDPCGHGPIPVSNHQRNRSLSIPHPGGHGRGDKRRGNFGTM